MLLDYFKHKKSLQSRGGGHAMRTLGTFQGSMGTSSHSLAMTEIRGERQASLI